MKFYLLSGGKFHHLGPRWTLCDAQGGLVESLIGDYPDDAVLTALRAKSVMRGRREAAEATLCQTCEGP